MTHLSHPGTRLLAAVRRRAVGLFVTAVTLLTAIVVALVAQIEFELDHSEVNWWAFGVFAVLLVIAETRPSFTLRFGQGGEITPGWAFAFALLLLGSPLSAVASCAVASVSSDMLVRKSFVKVLFNAAQVSLSLGLGALVLHAADLSGPLLSHRDITFMQSFGMIAAGLAVLVTSAMSLFVVMALSRGVSLLVPIREGWLTSVSADGALLAVAPIFVVAVDYNLLLLPMLGVTSFIVFSSARQAIRQSHAASHDVLTELPNRAAFMQDLDRRLASRSDPSGEALVGPASSDSARRVTLLLIDLDGFKEVNDRLGHATGDALLVAFAERLERCIPASALAARLGGDEFAIVLDGDGTIEQEMATVGLLRKRMCQTVEVNGFPLSISMSIGVALAPEHGNVADELMSCADIAMYRAKRARTGVELYGSIGATRERGRVGLLGDLSSALERSELTVCYQPQVRMDTSECDGLEALIRWQHPDYGPVAPGDFIGVAEHTELIVPLTRFVLERAVADLIALDDPKVAVAVNISARNLQDRHFPQQVLDTLGSGGLDPHRLELEITESAIAAEPERSRLAIESLREAGVRIAIDDFGTGYSSFSSLRDLDVDRIKIDRSFIQSLATSAKDQILVRSIVELSAELGLESVAEGIEDQAMWDLVASLGCPVGQGFLIARPMVFDDIASWLRRRPLATTSAPADLAGLVDMTTPTVPPGAAHESNPASLRQGIPVGAHQIAGIR
jgi:diguanylate cyclase